MSQESEGRHKRFIQQAVWTASLRRYAFNRLGSARARVLEVGCGTGAVQSHLVEFAQNGLFGIDIHIPSLRFARGSVPSARLSCSDAHHLPFPPASFDAVLCHFLLLWVTNPAQVITEMARVCRPGGLVMALAEPDYGGRIDFPPELAEPGRLQAASLNEQGADVQAGRKLAGWMRSAGLEQVENGVLGAQWVGLPSIDEWNSEWETLERDLAGKVTPAQLANWKEQDRATWDEGSRVLFVPTFYALARR